MNKIQRIILLLPFLLFFGTTFSQPVLSDLNGIWVPVKLELGGELMPEESYKTQKLTISDSNYTYEAESIDKGIVSIIGNKMDLYGKDGVNKGKHFTAIFKLENDELTICYNLKGDTYPETFETKGKPLFFLAVFKKSN